MGTARLILGETVLVLLVAGLFTLLGLRRSIYIEVYGFLGIAIGALLADPLRQLFVPWANLIWQFLQSLIGGRLTGVGLPAGQDLLIKTPADERVVGSLVFGVIVVFLYSMGVRNLKNRITLLARLLGGVAGAVNGYLVTYFLFPRHLRTDQPLIITLPSVEMYEMLGNNLARVILVLVLVLLTFGVLTTRRTSRQE